MSLIDISVIKKIKALNLRKTHQDIRSLLWSTGSSLLCTGFLQLQRARATVCCAQASHCSGFPCCGAQVLGHAGIGSCSTQAQQLWLVGSVVVQASVVVARELSSCDAWAQLVYSIWNLPGPGIKPMSPELVAGFLSTAPPRKSQIIF